jgi:hypothetical protein
MTKARDLADFLGDNTSLDEINDAYDAGAFSNRNVIMNGNFEINQRGASSHTGLTGLSKGPDRWMWAKNDTVNYNASYNTFSNTFNDIPAARGYMTFTLNSAGSGTDFVTIQQRVEDVRTCAGEEVTLSFWAQSSTGSSFTLSEAASISHGPIAVQQIFGSGGSSAVLHVVASSITLNTTWTKYSYTFTIPSVSGKTLGTSHHTRLYLCTMVDGDAGKGVQIAQVQLERGNVATPFEHRSFGDELVKCQRYYFSLNYPDGAKNTWLHPIATNSNGGWRRKSIHLPVSMRSVPTCSASFTHSGGTSGIDGGVWTGANTIGLYVNSIASENDYAYAYNITADAEL